MRTLQIKAHEWPLNRPFRLARGEKHFARVVCVEIHQDGHCGRAESVPYPHYGESVHSVLEAIESQRARIENGADVHALNQHMPAGAARNALDCALWDLHAKLQGHSVSQLLQLNAPAPLQCTATVVLDSAEVMAEQAREYRRCKLLKVKIDDRQVHERLQAVSQAAPKSRLIIDANESWNLELLNAFTRQWPLDNIALIEQPLSASEDGALRQYTGGIALCADESIHTRKELPRVRELYQCINIKTDKTGGLTEALALARDAQAAGLQIMLGCMVGSSMAMAPAHALSGMAQHVDLDGPAHLAWDWPNGFSYANGCMHAPSQPLWGHPET